MFSLYSAVVPADQQHMVESVLCSSANVLRQPTLLLHEAEPIPVVKKHKDKERVWLCSAKKRNFLTQVHFLITCHNSPNGLSYCISAIRWLHNRSTAQEELEISSQSQSWTEFASTEPCRCNSYPSVQSYYSFSIQILTRMTCNNTVFQSDCIGQPMDATKGEKPAA